MKILRSLLHRGLTFREIQSRQVASTFLKQKRLSPIVVAILHNWGDFALSLRHLTPNGDGVWGNVSFVPYGAVRNPDFVLVLNSIREWRKILRIAPDRLWFACSEASNEVHTLWRAGQGNDSTVVTTARTSKDKIGARKYIQSPPITPSWWVHKSYRQLVNSDVILKSRNLSWITSNFNNLQGHRNRLEFLERLRHEVDFDLFGRGFLPLDDKWEGLAPYRYSIAFENTRAQDYFTEKIMDCFVCNTLPIYFGAPNIGKYFPEKSFITLDPNAPNLFKEIREIASSDLWRERLPYILEAKDLVLNKYNMYARLAGWFNEADRQKKLAKRWILLKRQRLNFDVSLNASLGQLESNRSEKVRF